jgi:iron complex transport system permease protein
MTRPAIIMITILLFGLLAVILSTSLGEMVLTPMEVIRGALGIGEADHTMVIRELRLPRIVVALLAGASLAAAGAVLQGVVHNPMASPDMLGVTGGASVAAVIFLTYFSDSISIRWLPVAAMIGAILVSVILYILAWKKGISPFRLILVGIGMASLMSAMTTMMIIFSPKNDPGQAYLWLTGSVYGSNWENVLTILPWTITLLPLAYGFSRQIDIGKLGDDIAIGVGSKVQRNRVILLGISVALAGSAVSVAGGVGFIGLVAPHMASKLVGANFRNLLPTSALLGGIIVMLADLVGRTILLPLDIPVGIVTSAIGAPFFIYLLFTRRDVR